jgi:hypothetical protein
MRAPSTQTRILAFAPIQLCAWAFALFFGYHYFHGEPVFWPVVITVAFLLNVIRAHEQVQTYRAWKREWDAMSGVPTRPTRWPRLLGLALVGAPLAFLFYDVGQHGGASAILGVVLLVIIPLLGIGLALKLIRGMMRRKAAKVMPVTICVSRSMFNKPDIARAYRDLPAYCRAILRTVP